MRAEPDLDMHRRPEDSNELPFALRTGGEGASDTHVICGFFNCDARPFNPLLGSLPWFIRLLCDASSASQSLLDQFIRFATAETGNKRAWSQSVLNRLSELMFSTSRRLALNAGRTIF
jgi:Cupin